MQGNNVYGRAETDNENNKVYRNLSPRMVDGKGRSVIKSANSKSTKAPSSKGNKAPTAKSGKGKSCKSSQLGCVDDPLLECPKGTSGVITSEPSCFAGLLPVIVVPTDALNGKTFEITMPGYYVPEDPTFVFTQAAIALKSSLVTIEGFKFDGASNTKSAIFNRAQGLKSIAILNNMFTGYTGRTITYGFSEGTASFDKPGSNFVVQGNNITQFGADPTAIAAFNIDGVTIKSNSIAFDSSATGRRGINLDGSSNIVVEGNQLVMGANSAWSIQLATSRNINIGNIQILNNVITGVGIVGLSGANIDNVAIICNTIAAFRPISFNTGTAPPVANVSFTRILVSNNILEQNSQITNNSWALGLRDLHTPMPQSFELPGSFNIIFDDVKLAKNVIKGNFSVLLRTYLTNNAMSYLNIVEEGNLFV